MMVYEDFEMGGQRIRGPSSLKRIAPLREGVHSRVYSFYGGRGTPRSPPCRVLLQSGLQRVEVLESGEKCVRACVCPLPSFSRGARLVAFEVLILITVRWIRPRLNQ